MTNSQPRTKRRTRGRHDEIVATAASLFLDKGYEGTSVQDIADRVGILKGSLFYYISTKEDLLYAVLCDIFAGARADIERIHALDDAPLDKVRKVAEAHVQNLLANRDKTAIYFRDFSSMSEERRAEITAERDYYGRTFTALLMAAQAEGSICPDLDINLTSGSLLGMLNMVHDWYQPSASRSPEKLAAEMGDLTVASVVCDPATHVPGHRRHV
jgi:TetR/AcrR family transcriptional regulator, cholesterol catabolism regulator